MRITRHVERAWVWYFSAALFLAEEILLPLPRSVLPFFRSALQEVPGPLAALLGMAALRSFLSLTVIALSAEIGVRLLARLKRPFRWGMLRVSLTLTLYGATTAHPILLLGLMGLAASTFFPKSTSPWTQPRRGLLLPAATIGALSLFIGFSGLAGWKKESPISPTADLLNAPSFVLFGLESVPSAFLNRAIFSRGLDFQKAYAVANHNYTSWFSVLSGRYPNASGVDTLFPTKRSGRVASDTMLPFRLAEKGYRTIFMTDCASLSFFDKTAGFNERFQPGQTMFGCMRTAMESRHPLNRVWGSKVLSNECSLFAEPARLFRAAQEKIEELSHSPVPYLLAVHSCSTAPERVFERLSPAEYLTRLETTLEKVRSFQDKVDAVTTNTWSIYFGNRGVVWSPKAKSLETHATGSPLLLNQYNVPLILMAPKRMPLNGAPEHLVSLLDIYPTVEKLAGLLSLPGDGRDLAESPRWDRAVVLSSSFPVKRNSPEFRRALQNVHLTSQGVAHFSEEEEIRLRGEANVALVQLPYRLLLTPAGNSMVFEEASTRRLRVSVARKQELLSQLCAHFSHAHCATLPYPSALH